MKKTKEFHACLGNITALSIEEIHEERKRIMKMIDDQKVFDWLSGVNESEEIANNKAAIRNKLAGLYIAIYTGPCLEETTGKEKGGLGLIEEDE